MENTCCFFGHRNIVITEELEKNLKIIIESLVQKGVCVFLFGSKSKFNDICYEAVSGLKERYSDIRRIYVRAEFPDINEDYEKYLLSFYEETYYPKKIVNAGRAVYVERNCEMIEKSGYCFVYYDENNSRATGKSGTRLALEFAQKMGRNIINIREMS